MNHQGMWKYLNVVAEVDKDSVPGLCRKYVGELDSLCLGSGVSAKLSAVTDQAVVLFATRFCSAQTIY